MLKTLLCEVIKFVTMLSIKKKKKKRKKIIYLSVDNLLEWWEGPQLQNLAQNYSKIGLRKPQKDFSKINFGFLKFKL